MWSFGSFVQIALLTELLRLRQKKQLPSEVTAEDMKELLVEESKSTLRVRWFIGTHTHTHAHTPALHLSSSLLMSRQDVSNEGARNSEDEACVFFLFEGSGSQHWRTLMTLTLSLSSGWEDHNLWSPLWQVHLIGISDALIRSPPCCRSGMWTPTWRWGTLSLKPEGCWAHQRPSLLSFSESGWTQINDLFRYNGCVVSEVLNFEWL